MKKKIVSVILMAVLMFSFLTICSCSDTADDSGSGGLGLTLNPDGSIGPVPVDEKKTCQADNCNGKIIEIDVYSGIVVCKKNPFHIYKICVENRCDNQISLRANYCSKCGTEQTNCSECRDGEVDGLYCTKCGRYVYSQKNTNK